jgi:hypothetical protein
MKSRPKNILNDLFSIRNISKNFVRDIIKPGGVQVKNSFQRTLVTSLKPTH